MLGCFFLPARGEAANAAVAVVRATPFQGHEGDPIDLSGSGLPPHRQINFLMACPSWHGDNVYDYKNFTLREGPITDGKGEFAGYLLSAIHLHHVSPPMGCQIYASVPAENVPFFPGITPATYEIRESSARLSRCSRALCLNKVTAAPQRVRAGYQERIWVKGWPGATVDVTLSYPTHDVHHRHPLDWNGEYEFVDTVPEQLSDQTRVKITVRAWLGRMEDTANTGFTVTR